MSSTISGAQPSAFRPKALYLALLACTAFPVAAQQEPDGGVTQLDAVVVTASGFEQEIKNAPASISVITREQLETRPFQNLGDAVSDVEGVTVERGGKAGGMNISIRGMPSDYTLILVDGKRMNQNSSGARPNGFGDVDTNFIPPMAAIERIEVVRGPMSTLYGSDAMGGVINIITRKVSNEWHGQVTLNGTAQFDNRFGNNYGASFYLSGPIKTDLLGISLRGGYYRRLSVDGSYPSNAAEAASGDYTGDLASFSGMGETKQRNAGIRLALTPNRNHDIMLDVDGNWQTYDNRNQEVGTLNSNIAPGRTGGGYTDEAKFNRTRYSLTHLGRFGSVASDSSILYDTTETKGRTNPMTAAGAPTDGQPRKLEYDNIVFDTKWSMPLFNDRHYLTVGGQWRDQKFKDTLIDAPLDLKQYQWALFAENEWRMTDALALTLGARYDRNEQFGGEWSPRAYLVWNATSDWTFKGGVSKGYRTPDVNRMTDGVIGLGGQGTIPLLGNSQLTPERSTASELGVVYDNGQDLRGNFTLFQTKFKDKLDSEYVANCRAPNGNVPGCIDIGDWIGRDGNVIAEFSRPVNVDTATIRGFELGGNVPLYEGLTFNANYTLTRSKQTSGVNEGQPLGSQPRHALNLGLNWKINDRASAWVRGEYRAKQYIGLNNEKEQVFFDPYWLASVGGTYAVNKSVTVSASIYNLFDKDFVNYGDRKAFGNTAWRNSFRQYQEGRRLWVSTNITF